MKITRTDIEGPGGRATLQRVGDDIEITIASSIPNPGPQTHWQVPATDFGEQHWIARHLQAAVDGARGTNSMIDDYYRLIQQLGD